MPRVTGFSASLLVPHVFTSLCAYANTIHLFVSLRYTQFICLSLSDTHNSSVCLSQTHTIHLFVSLRHTIHLFVSLRHTQFICLSLSDTHNSSVCLSQTHTIHLFVSLRHTHTHYLLFGAIAPNRPWPPHSRGF